MNSHFVQFTKLGEVCLASESVTADGLGPREVLMRNQASLISAGTELANLHNLEGVTKYPTRSGYASIGVIEAKGAEVADFQLGERVYYTGNHALLQRHRTGEDHQWGRLYPCPREIDTIDATMACLANIALVGVNVTEMAVGRTVAVFGLGLIGNLAAQLYQLSGARVIAIDPVKSRCELARKVGIETVLDLPPERQAAAVRELTGGAGAEVTVDVVGHSAVVSVAVDCTAHLGQVILLGSPRTAVQGNLTDAFKTVHLQCLTMRGAHTWQFPAAPARGVTHTVASMLATCFELIRAKKLRVRELVSHIIPPSRVAEAYHGLQHQKEVWTGAVIDWTKPA